MIELNVFEEVAQGDGEFDFGEGEGGIEAGDGFAFEGSSVTAVEGEGW